MYCHRVECGHSLDLIHRTFYVNKHLSYHQQIAFSTETIILSVNFNQVFFICLNDCYWFNMNFLHSISDWIIFVIYIYILKKLLPEIIAPKLGEKRRILINRDLKIWQENVESSEVWTSEWDKKDVEYICGN